MKPHLLTSGLDLTQSVVNCLFMVTIITYWACPKKTISEFHGCRTTRIIRRARTYVKIIFYYWAVIWKKESGNSLYHGIRNFVHCFSCLGHHVLHYRRGTLGVRARPAGVRSRDTASPQADPLSRHMTLCTMRAPHRFKKGDSAIFSGWPMLNHRNQPKVNEPGSKGASP